MSTHDNRQLTTNKNQNCVVLNSNPAHFFRSCLFLDLHVDGIVYVCARSASLSICKQWTGRNKKKSIIRDRSELSLLSRTIKKNLDYFQPSANCTEMLCESKKEKRFTSHFAIVTPADCCGWQKCSKMSSFEKTAWKTWRMEMSKKANGSAFQIVCSAKAAQLESKLHLALMRKSEMLETMQYFLQQTFILLTHFPQGFAVFIETSNFQLQQKFILLASPRDYFNNNQHSFSRSWDHFRFNLMKDAFWEISLRWANERLLKKGAVIKHIRMKGYFRE